MVMGMAVKERMIRRGSINRFVRGEISRSTNSVDSIGHSRFFRNDTDHPSYTYPVLQYVDVLGEAH